MRTNIAGIVTGIQNRISKKGNRFAYIQLSDQTGTIEVLLFSDVLSLSRDLLESDAPLLIEADATLEEGAVKLIGQSVKKLDDVLTASSRGLEIKLSSADALTGIKDGLSRDGKGGGNLVLAMHVDGKMVKIPVPGSFRLSSGFRQMVKALPGISSIRELK